MGGRHCFCGPQAHGLKQTHGLLGGAPGCVPLWEPWPPCWCWWQPPPRPPAPPLLPPPVPPPLPPLPLPLTLPQGCEDEGVEQQEGEVQAAVVKATRAELEATLLSL